MNKATTMLAKTKSAIGVELLGVQEMMRNGNYSQARRLGDASFGEFFRQLEYKTRWYGSRVVKADRFFPSTKRCSQCGVVKEEMPLSERIFNCCNCGFGAGRDYNAALNLQQVAVRYTETLNACLSQEVHAEMQVPGYDAGREMLAGGINVC